MQKIEYGNRVDYYYFAYGSNMDAAQMRARCPSARKVANGVVRGVCLVFNRRGTYRPGGVASIEPCTPNSQVHGIVWRLSAEDLQRLDDIEDPNAYRRELVRVWEVEADPIEAVTYRAIPEADEITPDAEYLAIIITAAKEAGFPVNYLEMLERFRAV